MIDVLLSMVLSAFPAGTLGIRHDPADLESEGTEQKRVCRAVVSAGLPLALVFGPSRYGTG